MIRVNRKKAADMIGVTPATLRRWAADGKGPSYILLGNRAMYVVEDVEAWIEANSEPVEVEVSS